MSLGPTSGRRDRERSLAIRDDHEILRYHIQCSRDLPGKSGDQHHQYDESERSGESFRTRSQTIRIHHPGEGFHPQLERADAEVTDPPCVGSSDEDLNPEREQDLRYPLAIHPGGTGPREHAPLLQKPLNEDRDRPVR